MLIKIITHNEAQAVIGAGSCVCNRNLNYLDKIIEFPSDRHGCRQPCCHLHGGIYYTYYENEKKVKRGNC